MKKAFRQLVIASMYATTLFPVSAFADNAKSGEFHTDGIKTQDGNFVYSVNDDDDTATLVQYIGSEDALAANTMKLIFLPSLTDEPLRVKSDRPRLQQNII